MLARRTTINHPLGQAVDLPILVPSFSSKGFPFFRDRESRVLHSEATLALEAMTPFITESLLVSAYDIHHKYLRGPKRSYTNKDLVFIDSGGYELSDFWDSTEPNQGSYTPRPFKENEYLSVLKSLPKNLPFVITNCDWSNKGASIEDQILAAQKLFNKYPKFMSNFLVKPTKDKKYLNINEVMPHLGKLRRFHILGVTEKELGKNLIDRLINLAKLRVSLDRDHIPIPIHVWGGLDPLLSSLYFFAGAEIFDGVSWLRYGYHAGLAVYRDCQGILANGIETSFDHSRALTLSSNLTFLRELSSAFRLFVDRKATDFSMFPWHSKEFAKLYQVLSTKVPELNGGA